MFKASKMFRTSRMSEVFETSKMFRMFEMSWVFKMPEGLKGDASASRFENLRDGARWFFSGCSRGQQRRSRQGVLSGEFEGMVLCSMPFAYDPNVCPQPALGLLEQND